MSHVQTSIVGAYFLNVGRLWLLLGVAALVGLYTVAQFSRRKHVVDFTNVDLLDSLAPNRPGWRRHFVAVFYMLAAVFGVISIARPVTRSIQQTESGGKILLVFDVSLSMQATDVNPNRLDAAKKAGEDFVDQVDDNIEVGLISFNQDVNVRLSPTLNHKAVKDAIQALKLGEGTAIGDALSTAAEVIGPPTKEHPDEPAGAIVLLSDGETTAGTLATAEGAQIVAQSKIPAYAIAFGTADGTVVDSGTGETVPVPVNIDELRGVADITGAKFFEAPSASALEQAYNEISTNLNAGSGDPIKIIKEQTWKYAAAALALLAFGWAIGLWLLRGLL
jgi:Ca-activated chloride channel homolog